MDTRSLRFLVGVASIAVGCADSSGGSGSQGSESDANTSSGRDDDGGDDEPGTADDTGTTSPGSESSDTGSDPPEIEPERLGAHYDAAGDLHVVVRSQNAERMEVWLYEEPRDAPESWSGVLDHEGDHFRITVPAAELARAGLVDTIYYGLRVWGPNFVYDPAWTPGSLAGFLSDRDDDGHRFNPNKLVLDVYARELSHDPFGPPDPEGSPFKSGEADRAIDSAPYSPKGVVLPHADDAPGTNTFAGRQALVDQIVYEVHVRGLTMNDPTVPVGSRGTYAGAAMRAPYLADLGITAIEFLPLHEAQNDQNDVDPESADGDNYWGYATWNFFAPDRRYAADKSAGGPTREFKAMVQAFHDVGISVWVDVVYNHNAEGGAGGPGGSVANIVSWRGIDETSYYQPGDNPGSYQNDNGVGPNLAATRPLARDMVIDSLRYWHEDLGVDGFRFDLAPILGNGCEAGCFDFDEDDREGILVRARAELPDAVLIAEPWGTGAGTYQIGNFPAGWAEWNGQYRDLVRQDQNMLGVVAITPGALANRFSGSWDLFGDDERKPWHSINFIVAHDGFTHRDLYACNEKDNDQEWPWGPSNGGSNDNFSWDHNGSPEAQRAVARAGMALLMLSAGVPMITGGDELYRTQQCNNNPYNLDSPAIWLDWGLLDEFPEFHHFARELMRFRLAHPVLRPLEYRPNEDGDGNGVPPIRWLRSNGQTANGAYLDNANNHFIGFVLDGAEVGDPASAIYVGYNGWSQGLDVTLPDNTPGMQWYLVADTHAWLEPEGNFLAPGSEETLPKGPYLLGARSVLILVEAP